MTLMNHHRMHEVVRARDILSTVDLLLSHSYQAVWEWIFHKDLQKEQRDLNWQVAHRALPVQTWKN